MKVRNANNVLNKISFNNQTDWETYPTADYTCDKCNQIVSLDFKDLTKHAHKNFSNLIENDRKCVEETIKTFIKNIPSSYLDFYCPTCNRVVCIYYDSRAGGHHTEVGYELKYVID